MKKVRIAKLMARSGLCSRREAERWIAAGRVLLSGHLVTEVSTCAATYHDVHVDGHPLPPPESPRLWAYHKPTGLVTTRCDEKGRPTVFDHLPSLPRVISVGRLDMNTEGLLLLTNDGQLSRLLEHPMTGLERVYRVRLYGHLSPAALRALHEGVTVDGVLYRGLEARVESRTPHHSWVRLTLREGKNREIRKLMHAFGATVCRLIRVSYGPFLLGTLERGHVCAFAPPLYASYVKLCASQEV